MGMHRQSRERALSSLRVVQSESKESKEKREIERDREGEGGREGTPFIRPWGFTGEEGARGVGCGSRK